MRTTLVGAMLAAAITLHCGPRGAQCGTGTIEVNGQCTLRCGAGTELFENQCVPLGSVVKAGHVCTGLVAFECEEPATALECISGTWSALPCRGPGGCTNMAATVRCDISANEVGDRCASTAEGRGLCSKDGKGTLECRQGVLVKTNVCRSCTVTGDSVVCQP
jgi:hypothetical protein